MKRILDDAKAIQNKIVKHRRFFHENAEVGAELPKTKEYVLSQLKNFGYDPAEICESGIVAIAGGKKAGKTILIRGDMDALSLEEETDLAFKSKTGNMHACGHDMHAAMLLGVAELLKNNEEEIEGTIKLMFQPDEEGFTGAERMVNAGVLESPKVDAALALHVTPLLPSGVVLGGSGKIASSCDRFRITITGRGGHGAFAHETIDPINVGAHIHTALQTINSREVDAMEPAVVTIGSFNGGDEPNIIPDKVVMEGTVRTHSKDTRNMILRRIDEISKSIACAFNAKSELEIMMSCPALYNEHNFSNEIISYISALLGKEKVVCSNNKIMGSEDFSHISDRVQSFYMGFGSGNAAEGYIYSAHNSKVMFNEEILYQGSATLVYAALEWLKNNKS
ncbi:M20 metallopeptidase family protein [Oceanirhabdus seepicola]|uniref:Amidohydrolase n=1 Tax=Oceanirhabdus seepicola TaxID=2828781 RepID=A0A9J6NZN3_9CLOT|nr:M20 family metallopeptidase [Oceanirhabdus seepicola]MCM1989422.1 amidohydrolase [Oceanirhabdus seepicola]